MVTSQRYSSSGQTLTSSSEVSTAYQYTGQRNTGLGIYYYGARFYDGALGRFLTPDTIIPQPGSPQDWDRYAYVRNDPINATDPSGHRPCDEVGADAECKIPQKRQTLTIHQRLEQLEDFANDPMIPNPFGNIGAPMTAYSPYWMKASDGTYIDPYLSWLNGFVPYIEFTNFANDFMEFIEFADNVGTPVYKQWKGSLPGGPFIEGTLGFTTQLASDLNDHSIVRSGFSIIGRAATAGVEDAITESISTPVGAYFGGLGTACGPAAPVCAGIGYLAGANATTWFLDNVVWQPINNSNRFHRK